MLSMIKAGYKMDYSKKKKITEEKHLDFLHCVAWRLALKRKKNNAK